MNKIKIKAKRKQKNLLNFKISFKRIQKQLCSQKIK